MKSCGVILTYIKWSDWKELPFNIALFLFQLTFLVVGTAYGKIKWSERPPRLKELFWWFFVWCFLAFVPKWWNIPVIIIWLSVIIAVFRGIDWRKTWRAAQCSHVRLVLEKAPDDILMPINSYWTANFGWPTMEIQPWEPDWSDGKRFEYREPTFEPSDEFIAAMIQYAREQEGKRYDHLQLLSFGLNFIVWLFWPPWWGQEKLKWLNLRGGREVCSSGVTACLRWGEGAPRRAKTRFFKIYHTAVVPPCLVPLSKNWRRDE